MPIITGKENVLAVFPHPVQRTITRNGDAAGVGSNLYFLQIQILGQRP